MGFAFVMASCCGCGQPFTFHPNLVPSITIEGARRPICRACVNLVNPQRIKNGLEPIRPLPGAYEAADESEIDWDQ